MRSRRLMLVFALVIALFGSTLALAGPAASQALTCTGTRAASDVTLSFDGTVGSSIQLLRDGRWLQTVTNETSVTLSAALDAQYSLRVRDAGNSFDVDCTVDGAGLVPVAPSCTIIPGDVDRLEFAGTSGQNVQLRLADRWVATVSDRAGLDVAGDDALDEYFIRVNGGQFDGDIPCLRVGEDPPPALGVCNAVRTGSLVELTFDGSLSSSVQLRRDGRWLATVTDTNAFTDSSAIGTRYVLRVNLPGGARTDIPCGETTSAEPPANNGAPVCRVDDEGTMLVFSGDLGVNVQLRRFGRWVADVTGANSADADGTDGYVIRVRGGTRPGDVECETVSTEVVTDNGVVILDTIPFPENPTPFEFAASADGFDGVDLTVSSSGGLYPWDVRVQEAFTTPAMESIIVSELVDLALNPEAADAFDGASLTLEHGVRQHLTVASA